MQKSIDPQSKGEATVRSQGSDFAPKHIKQGRKQGQDASPSWTVASNVGL